MAKDSDGVGRREALAGLGILGAVGTYEGLRHQVPGPRRPPARGRAARPPEAGPEVQALFGEIRPGAAVGDCRVVAVHDVTLGAIPVVLETAAGERFQVDVLARGGATRTPVAWTRSLEVYVVAGGDGQKATPEQQGLGAMALAAALDAREEAGARVPALLTFERRRERHPLGAYGVMV